MPEVYYYVKSDRVSDILDCGLKLSQFYDKTVLIQGEMRQCFSGLVNPKDDLRLYESDSHTCLKIQVKSSQCFIADRFVYETCRYPDKELEYYYNTVVPIDRYRFGRYRLPECLITTTILDSDVALLDRIMDSPVIYRNAEELYINNILEDLKDQYQEIEDILLYHFFDRLAELKKIDKIENSSNKTTVFFDRSGKTYCLKQPEIDKFILSGKV